MHLPLAYVVYGKKIKKGCNMKYIFLIVLSSGILCAMEQATNKITHRISEDGNQEGKFDFKHLREVSQATRQQEEDNKKTEPLTEAETLVIKKILTSNKWFFNNH